MEHPNPRSLAHILNVVDCSIMDEATEYLIFEIQLQDSREIYEEHQAQSRQAQIQQDEYLVTAEDSGELQGYDHEV